MSFKINLSREVKELLEEFRLHSRQDYNTILIDVLTACKIFLQDKTFKKYYIEESRREDNARIQAVIEGNHSDDDFENGT